MNLRGIARAAAAATVTALFVGGLGTPAHAGDEPAGAILNLPYSTGVYAATAPKKGCAGIDTGVAVADKDGWLFNKPPGQYAELNYVLSYIDGDFADPAHVYWLILNADGVFSLDISDGRDTPAPTAKSAAQAIPPLTLPAPAGVTGKLVDDGGWIKTPKGWGVVYGYALSKPMLDDVAFFLVRACAAANPSTHPPTPSGGPALPVTGDSTGLVIGAGVAMVAVGAVLFVVYRRRRNVTFVA